MISLLVVLNVKAKIENKESKEISVKLNKYICFGSKYEVVFSNVKF